MRVEARRRLAIALLLFVAGTLAGLVALGLPLGVFDEALILVGAERILHGELPYRDFYAFYPPGQYFTAAALFALLGVKVLALRIYDVLVRSAIALLLFLLTRRSAGPAAALAAWAGSLMWLLAVGNFGYPAVPALALVLLGITLLARAVDSVETGSAPAWLAAAGAAVGAAALFRHDLGAYGLVATAPLLIAATTRRGEASAPGATASRRERARRLFAFVAGLGIAFLPPAAWLLSRAPWREVAFELFTYPFEAYASMRGLPAPPLLPGPFELATFLDLGRLARATAGVPFVAPLIACVAGLLWVIVEIARGPRERPVRPAILTLAGLALLGLLTQSSARLRPDPIHALVPVIVSLAVTAAWARLALARGKLLARSLAVLAIAVQLCVVLAAVAALQQGAAAGLLGRVAPGALATRSAGLPAGGLRRELADYLRTVVPLGGRIFVGCGRHDRILINEPILYFLSERLPGGKYHALDPGVATTRAVQEEIVGGLERHRVEWIVLSTRFDDAGEPNASSISSGVTLLDDYLRAHYAPDRRFGPWLTVLRRSAPWGGGVPTESEPPEDGGGAPRPRGADADAPGPLRGAEITSSATGTSGGTCT